MWTRLRLHGVTVDVYMLEARLLRSSQVNRYVRARLPSGAVYTSPGSTMLTHSTVRLEWSSASASAHTCSANLFKATTVTAASLGGSHMDKSNSGGGSSRLLAASRPANSEQMAMLAGSSATY